MTEEVYPVETVSALLVTQGKHKFYTVTMPSEVLIVCCTVDTRESDPIRGFQRMLDEKRADDIAKYVDDGGTIPSSIVLSAQPAAELDYNRSRRSISFRPAPGAFLILDGQHRVFGFAKATSRLRVPVVIYNGLSRVDECRLFIDMNTKQRPVPNALLLDIKRLAETESTSEAFYRDLFDLFLEGIDSPLYGLLSPASQARDRISRVTFNASMKVVRDALADVSPERAYAILSPYLHACRGVLVRVGCDDRITNPTVFKGLLLLFADVAERVNDRHRGDYSLANFSDVLDPLKEGVKATMFNRPGKSPHKLADDLKALLRRQFRVS